MSHFPDLGGRRRRLPLAMLALLLSQAPALSAGGPVFTDITAQAGVALNSDLVESIAWGDYDNDGDEDLFLAVNGLNRLYRNDGVGPGGLQLTETAASVGLTENRFSVGSAFGDFDNDGDLDLYVVSFGSGADMLYRNDGPTGVGGEYVFTEIGSAAGIAADESSSRGVALIDYDRDGLLDIYVNAIGADILYHNLGGLTFENVAASVGITGVSGQGVGAVASDVNGDGLVDLFTGNRSFDLNRLFLNQGGTFLDTTVAAGLSETGLGMGVLAFDYDNDLDIDLYWTSWPGGEPAQPNALYENLGGAMFANRAAVSGTEDPTGWGISVNAGDVDGDGWNDFFVTNGFDPSTGPNVLFHNQGDGTFGRCERGPRQRRLRRARCRLCRFRQRRRPRSLRDRRRGRRYASVAQRYGPRSRLLGAAPGGRHVESQRARRTGRSHHRSAGRGGISGARGERRRGTRLPE